MLVELGAAEGKLDEALALVVGRGGGTWDWGAAVGPSTNCQNFARGCAGDASTFALAGGVDTWVGASVAGIGEATAGAGIGLAGTGANLKGFGSNR